MTGPAPVYKRAPSKELEALLSPGGFLEPVVRLAKQKVGGNYHDVHFRRNDEVFVYRGHSAVLQIRRYKRIGGLTVTADEKYKSTPFSEGIFGRWTLNENGFEEALFDYLSGVDVSGSLTLGEGDIQLRWSRVTEPWVPFDREAVLSYADYARGEERNNATRFGKVNEARAELEKSGWAKLPRRGRELDQLAVDPVGRLVLLELKDGSKNDAEVYYSPLQLLQYIWEWHTALEAVRADLQSVIDARVAVKLTPRNVPHLTGGIRPVVGFGLETPNGDTKLHYEEVLGVINQHLPDGVEPIETWAFTNSGPTRLAI